MEQLKAEIAHLKIISHVLALLQSKPGKYLLLATLLIIIATLVFPYLLLGELMGFQPLPLSFLLIIGLIVVFYLISAEIVKTVFYKKVRS